MRFLKPNEDKCDIETKKIDRALSEQERALLETAISSLKEPGMKSNDPQKWLDQIPKLHVIQESYCSKHNHLDVYFQHYRKGKEMPLVSISLPGDQEVNVFVDDDSDKLSMLEVFGVSKNS